MALALLLFVARKAAPPSCPKPSAPVQQNICGDDLHQLATDNYTACQSACCASPSCRAWNWDSNLTAAQRPSSCHPGGHAPGPAVGGCCWLKGCGDECSKGKNCGTGADPATCVSWSGVSGRATMPPPPPPWCDPSGPTEPPCFHNAGVQKVGVQGVTHSFDCEVRKHAWEFAKATLPERGDFRTAYDALQLHACGVPAPRTIDGYRVPNIPTPIGGKLIYVDAAAAASGGDGSQAKPFRTLEAAVDTATGPGAKTILLKAGKYHTTGIVLTAAHSDLTIQNLEGGEVVISGAVPVANTRAKWSIHNKTSNTWKLDTSGQALPPEFGMRIGTRRAIRAKFPNGDPETAPAFCEVRKVFDPGSYLPGSGRSMSLPAYFPRQHESTNRTVEYWAHPSDWPGVFWHNDTNNIHPQSIGGYGPFFYAEGGVCSGRTPQHGCGCL